MREYKVITHLCTDPESTEKWLTSLGIDGWTMCGWVKKREDAETTFYFYRVYELGKSPINYKG